MSWFDFFEGRHENQVGEKEKKMKTHKVTHAKPITIKPYTPFVRGADIKMLWLPP